MKSSEIITDDILSRERSKTKDVYDKKTTSQDYFGNRKDKRDDHELISKDKSKERKKEWFEEGSMQAATHKPEGPKFGGYYGAQQKGPPKPGQGFGGAAESVGQELDEVAPPGMEDWVKKNKERFKKEYGDKKGSSVLYATAWKMHNKGKK